MTCIESSTAATPIADTSYVHPQVIEKNGDKDFVILPYEEFLAIRDELEDHEDLKVLRLEKSESAGQSSRPLDDILKELDG
jgi:hypothetical protein